jgi:hypothetical protein
VRHFTDPDEQQLRRPEHALPPEAEPQVGRPYSQFQRVAYGSWWTFITAILIIGGFIGLVESPGVAFLAMVLGALAGRYAYRLWTWQARRLVFFIIF